MKALKFFDLMIQTLLMSGIVVSIVAAIAAGKILGVPFILQLGGMLLGPWQILSALIMLFELGPLMRLRVIHLVGSGVYLAVALLLQTPDMYPPNATDVVLYVVPSALAILYFIISYRSLARDRSDVQAS